MARELSTLAFVDGKGWVAPEATAEQEAERLAAYEAVATLLKSTKDRKRRKDLEVELRRAHAACAQVCMVEVGVGAIRSIDERARNTRVNIDADHLSIPVHGYLDMTNFALWDQVAVVRANFGRCRYRIIVRRTPDIHPSVPWGEVEAPPVEGEDVKAVRIRDLVALSAIEVVGAAPDPALAGPPPAAAEAPPSQAPVAAAAGPVEPASTPAPAATTTLFPQPADGTIVCPLCGHPTAGSGPVYKHAATGRFAHKVCPTGTESPAASAPAADGDPGPVEEPAPADLNLGRGPRLAEPRPWERTDARGNLNLGSFAIQASVSMVELAVELLREHMAEAGEPGVPMPAAVKGLAHLLLMAADRTQQIVRPDHHFDRGDNSHTRARGAVRVALRMYPVPFRTAEETNADLGHRREVWVTNLVDFASMLIQTAVELDQ